MPRSAPATKPRPRRVGRLAVALVLSSAGAVVVPGRVLASGEGQSKSDSGNSGSNNSSNGSGDSSKNSNDSSKNSNDSSKSSNDSTQASPQRSADSSSEGTVNSSTKSRGAQTFWAGSAVVLLGASVVGTVLAARSRTAAPPPAVALAAFMRENHAVLTHDVALAHGPVFDAWSRELGLTAAERGRVAVALEGSPEQGELLASLDGSIDVPRARRFSAAFFRVTARALGPAATERLLARAARARQTDGDRAPPPRPLPAAAADHAG